MAVIRRTAVATALVVVAGIAAPPSARAETHGLTLTVADGRLSLEADGVPLQAILDEIADRAGVQVRFDDRTAAAFAGELVTTQLHNVPVEEALRLLLRGRNLVFVYAPRRLSEARIYGGDKKAAPEPPPAASVRSAPAAPAAPDPAALTRLRSEALESPDPTARWRALEAIAASGDRARTREAALAMLEREADPALLQRALDLVEADHTIPLGPLVKLALTNATPEVRLKALTHLGGDVARDPAARQALETSAANDPAPAVREAARALLQPLTPR